MNIIAVVNQIIMLFIITGVGWYLQHRGILTNAVIKGINGVVLKAAWPAMILMTTQKQCTDETLSGFLLVACVSAILLTILCIAIYFLLSKCRANLDIPVFTILSAMPNAGFVGLPIIQAVYGDAGVLYLAAFLVGFNVVLWTIGVFLFTGVCVRSLRNIFNAGFISAIVGTALFILRIELPTPLLSTVNQLGALTTPLSMLLLGARLPGIRLERLKNIRLWIAVAIKLLAAPVIALIVMRILRANDVLTGITVLSMAMPSASAAQMFAEKYESDVEFSVQGVSVSMLLCIVTVPLILLLLRL